jgi:purine-binding chemotaxis protein CheW
MSLPVKSHKWCADNTLIASGISAANLKTFGWVEMFMPAGLGLTGNPGHRGLKAAHQRLNHAANSNLSYHMSTKTTETDRSKEISLAGKYLSCNLGRESYAIPVIQVREIIRMLDITPIPQMPQFVKGVINLRGKIIPVVDLRERFGLGSLAATDLTCIVVVQVKLSSGSLGFLGLTVDGVEEVVNIAENEIEETPEFGTQVDTEFLLALAKVKGKVTALVDINKILAVDTVESLRANLKH